jgi:hypothetical protein
MLRRRRREGAADASTGGRSVEGAPVPADSDWIYGHRAGPTRRTQAQGEAEAIVKDAELRAAEIIAAAKEERARLERELADERALLAEERTQLAHFLARALAEVERTSRNGSEGAADHTQLQELQKRLTETE